jgi:hypothetical protein
MASKKIILTLATIGIVALLGGCGSDDDSSSDPVAPVIDTAPPALPGGVAVDYAADQQVINLTWDANVTDADLAGYIISRGDYANDPQDLTVEPLTATTFQDNVQPGECGRQVTYYVRCVDTSDNVSAAATATVVISQEPAVVEEPGPSRLSF